MHAKYQVDHTLKVVSFMYVLVTEVLSCVLERGQGGQLFLPSFRVRGRGSERVKMSPLMFADDTLVFWQ